MERTAKQIHNLIESAKNIMLVAHQNPDGDALGSVSALSYYLRRLDKPHAVFCATSSSTKLHSLPHLVKPSSGHEVWQSEPDVIIVLDSGDLKYAGVETIFQNLKHDYIVVNIDHHATNTYFGRHNLVMNKTAATAEVLYYFFRYNHIAIDKNMALSLLTGLITDTENFTNSGTTVNSLKIASELIHRGANFNLVKQWFLRDKSIPALKLWGAALSRLSRHEELDIVYTYITREDFSALGVDEAESEGVANFLNNLGEGRASLLLKEQTDGRVKGSFRTSRDDFDAGTIAKALGGGGHQKAAGFTIFGGIDEALNKVWQVLQNAGK